VIKQNLSSKSKNEWCPNLTPRRLCVLCGSAVYLFLGHVHKQRRRVRRAGAEKPSIPADPGDNLIEPEPVSILAILLTLGLGIGGISFLVLAVRQK